MRINKNILKIFFIFAFCFTLFFNFEINTKADIYDDANILTTEQFNDIKTKIEKIEMSKDYNIIIRFFNSEKPNMSDEAYYNMLVNWYNNTIIPTLESQPEKSKSIVLMFDFDSRILEVRSFGKLNYISFYNSKTADTVQSCFIQDNYYEGINYFVENIESEINSKTIIKLLIHILISIVIAAIIMFVLVYQSKGKITVSVNDYLNKSKTRTLKSRDTYIKTVTTKTKIEKSSGSGGGSGGGRARRC